MNRILDFTALSQDKEKLAAALSKIERPEELDHWLLVAAREGMAGVLEPLMAAGACIETGAESATWRPLHVAVEHSQVAVVRRLVELGADLSSKMGGGATPLHLAVDVAADSAEQNHEFGRAVDTEALEVLKLLLELGADPETLDERGRSPLDWANDAGYGSVTALFHGAG